MNNTQNSDKAKDKPYMKLILPDGKEVRLDKTLDIEAKKKVVDGILTEWGDYFRRYWNNIKTAVALEVISDYLVWTKDESQKGKEDKEILSVDKTRWMKKGRQKEIHFGAMSAEEKVRLGISEDADELNQ